MYSTVNACIYGEESTPEQAHFCLDFTAGGLEVFTFLAPTAPPATLLVVAELVAILLVVAELVAFLLVVAELLFTLLVVTELLTTLVEVREHPLPVLVLPSL